MCLGNLFSVDHIIKFCVTISMISLVFTMSSTQKACNDIRPCKGNNLSVIVKEGDDIDLRCSIFPLWKGIIVWSKEGNAFPLTLGAKRFYPDSRIVVYLTNSNIWYLKIKNSVISDSGMYECSDSISNEIILIYNVTVQKNDNGFPKEHEKFNYEETTGHINIKGPNVAFIGEKVHFQCRINLANIILPSYPFTSFRWFHNGKPQQTDQMSGITITQTWASSSILESGLIIKQVDINNSGSWVCLYALNDARYTQKNTATSSIYLTVLGSSMSSVKDTDSGERQIKNDKPKILRLKNSEYLNDHEYKSSTDKNNTNTISQMSLKTWIETILWEIILCKTVMIMSDL